MDNARKKVHTILQHVDYQHWCIWALVWALVSTWSPRYQKKTFLWRRQFVQQSSCLKITHHREREKRERYLQCLTCMLKQLVYWCNRYVSLITLLQYHDNCQAARGLFLHLGSSPYGQFIKYTAYVHNSVCVCVCVCVCVDYPAQAYVNTCA